MSCGTFYVCLWHMNATGLHEPEIRGWVRSDGRRGRWIEPFLLLLIADGPIHGYSVISRLNGMEVASEGIDVGMVYRTLREFESQGLVKTKWGLEEGPPRREYRLTAKGLQVLDEWVGVMAERRRLIEAFLDGAGQMGRADGS